MFPADIFRSKLLKTPLNIMILALLIGIYQKTFSSETEFGRFISTVPGKFYYLIIVYLLTVVFGLILQKLGFTLFRHYDILFNIHKPCIKG
jgi:hypothetical protein